MKNHKLMLVTALLSLGLVGCASLPPAEELRQLNGEELSERMVGNTWTSKHKWGTWAEYHAEGGIGFSKAWGNWGKEEAISTYTTSDEGETCWSYSGEAEWSNPEFQYCGVVLVDNESNTYYKSTVNDRKPERVGKIKKFNFKQGDEYGLSVQ